MLVSWCEQSLDMLNDAPVNVWDRELEELFLRTGSRFTRIEPRRRMRDYYAACSLRSAARTGGSSLQGFTVARDREAALTGAGLVLCATGAVSLCGEDFSHLRNGAYVATVTSSEDELGLAGLPDVYTCTQAGDHVTRYQTTGHYFYLANGGNAVNFIHGASVGPFIFLVQAEILAAIRMLTRGELAPGIHEVPAPDREAIAATWLSYFNR